MNSTIPQNPNDGNVKNQTVSDIGYTYQNNTDVVTLNDISISVFASKVTIKVPEDNVEQNYIFMSKVRDRSIKIGVLMRENITTSTTQIRCFLCKLRILFQWGATDYSVPACKFCCS